MFIHVKLKLWQEEQVEYNMKDTHEHLNANVFRDKQEALNSLTAYVSNLCEDMRLEFIPTCSRHRRTCFGLCINILRINTIIIKNWRSL